jgi:hypothetical protein
MDCQVQNMLEWGVSHKNFNHILNFNVVIEKSNLVIFRMVHLSVNKKWTQVVTLCAMNNVSH